VRAAVVAVLRRREPVGLELLMIKRAEHDRDPWSGHVALPGGREEPGDSSLEATAVREEIGLDLERDGRMLGALDDLSPRAAPVPITVRPYVAVVDRDVTLVLSDEVAAAFWVPVAALAAPGARRDSVVTVRGVERLVPSFRHEEYIVWGMTEHILRELLAELPRLLAATEGP
jgi:8-oxo-dGTP pyrophosphatase MutT (NUDIX family)